MSDKILKQGLDPNAAYLEFRDRWQAEEAGRLDQVRLAGQVPASASAEIAPAPARGPVKLYRHRETVITAAGFVTRSTTPATAQGVQIADAFDVMEAQAMRRAKSRNRAHEPLFTVTQIVAGRTYAQLAERVSRGGTKCSSLDGRAAGGGAGSFMDAYFRDLERLRAMEAMIAGTWALSARRASPHGDRRRAIPALELVRMVAVEGRTLTNVLSAYGWGEGLKNRQPLREALCAALDAMHEAAAGRPRKKRLTR